MQGKFRYLIFDLDGTLLNSKKRLSSRTLECLKKYKNEIVLCTGRHWGGVIHYRDLLNLDEDNYIIFDDGFYISRGNGEVLYKSEGFLQRELKELMNNICIDTYYVFTEYTDYLVERNIALYLWNKLRNRSSKLKVVRNEDEIIKSDKENLIKIYIPNIDMAKLDCIKEEYTLHKLDRMRLEILKCNKFCAIQKLCELTKTSMNDVMYFGDSINDIECFENLTYTIAMGNANEEIKKLSFKITGTNDNDGIAEILNDLK